MDFAINKWEDVDALAAGAEMRGSTWQKTDELQQLLRFLRIRPEVDLPLTIREGPDPPDFILASPTKATGVEVTWAANERWEQSIAHLGNKNPGFVRVSRNWLETTRKRGKELGEFLKRKQDALPIWSSDEYADAKALEVMDAIRRKTESLRKPYYQRFDENWLLIGDKNSFDFLDINEFSESLLRILREQAVLHDALYFVTRLRKEDVLFQLSRSHCRIVPSR